MLEKAKLGRLAPRWKGDRGDLVRVGGKKSRDPNSWNDSRRDLFDIDKKRIVALVIEVLVNLIISTYVYVFA